MVKHNLVTKFVLCMSTVKNYVTAVRKSCSKLKCQLKYANFERRNLLGKTSALKDLHRMNMKKQIIGRCWSFGFIFSLRFLGLMCDFFFNPKVIFAIAWDSFLGCIQKQAERFQFCLDIVSCDQNG